MQQKSAIKDCQNIDLINKNWLRFGIWTVAKVQPIIDRIVCSLAYIAIRVFTSRFGSAFEESVSTKRGCAPSMGIRKGADETVSGECSENQRIGSVSQHVMIETVQEFVSAIAIAAIVSCS
jgi:hypothetical protein